MRAHLTKEEGPISPCWQCDFWATTAFCFLCQEGEGEEEEEEEEEGHLGPHRRTHTQTRLCCSKRSVGGVGPSHRSTQDGPTMSTIFLDNALCGVVHCTMYKSLKVLYVFKALNNDIMVNRCASMMGAEGGGWCLREEGRKNWSRLASVSSSSSSSSSFVEAPADGKRLPWGKKEGRKSSYFSFDDLLVHFLQVVRSTHTHTHTEQKDGRGEEEACF